MVRLVALGGLGEIGLNLMVLSVGEDSFIIDCGVQFPDASMPGADLVLPDLRYLEGISGRIRALILTHGHEDHIGAVPHVLKLCPVPVYGTPFTLGLVHEKLLEHGLAGTVHTIPITPATTLPLGDVTFEFVRVTHSIPDCVSLVARTPAGTIIHTGDWKIDKDPVDGQHFDRARFEALGDEGVHLLLSDSTNAEVPGWNRGEREVAAAIESRVAAWDGRVLVTLFSSNVHRVGQVFDIAKRCGRKVCLVGRSLQKYVAVARSVGIFTHSLGDVVDSRKLDTMAGRDVLVILTGSQGEGRSALAQAALGEHRDLVIGPEDLLIFSSRKIPGNERAIARMINAIARQGAHVVHGYGTGVHTSGHAARDELAEMLVLTRPRHFVPVHGEFAFLQRHAELARELGVQNTLVAENGHILDVTPESVSISGRVRLSNFYVDADITADADALELQERVRLAWNGVVSVWLRVERTRDGLRVVPRLTSHGLYTDEERLIGACATYLADEMALLPAFAPARDISDSAELLVRRYFKRATGKKPVVLVALEVVAEVPKVAEAHA